MRKNLAIAFIFTTVNMISNAQAAPQMNLQKGGVCWASIGMKAALEPTTQFTCEGIGKVVVSQIYEKGYRIAAMSANPQHPEFVTIVIEEQR